MRETTPSSTDPATLDEYDVSNGVPGEYAQRYAEDSNVIVLALDLAQRVPDSTVVNDALRTLITISEQAEKAVA